MERRVVRSFDIVCLAATTALIIASLNAFHVSASFAAADEPQLSAERYDAGLMWVTLAIIPLLISGVRVVTRMRTRRSDPDAKL